MTYLWSNGSTTDTTTVIASGTYWIQVNRNGCIDRDTIQVTIVDNSFQLLNRDTSICRGQVVQAFVNYNPGSLFQWLPTAGIAAANTANPLIRPDTSATYKVVVQVSGCPDVADSFHIDVQPVPQVFAGGNRFICAFDTLHINASVLPAWYNAYQYHWYPATSLDDTTTNTAVFTAGNSGKYFVDVATPAGCKGRDSLVITVWPGNFATIGNDTTICPGDSVQVHITGGATYRWVPSMYVGDSTSGNPVIKAETSVTYTVTVSDIHGCRDTVQMRIAVWPAAVVYLTDSVRIYPGESYQIAPWTNCTAVQWFPPQGLDDYRVTNPIASPVTNTVYTFLGVTENGCRVKDSIIIFADPEAIVVMPNAFTPGGQLNGVFSPNFRGEAELSLFRVFDRWGVMVFETKSKAKGWDGTYNGQPQPLGVYVYYLEATTPGGQVVKKHGNVTLIR
ncbi:MAG: gliding motility-associated C-terminal domain-containing protein [Chitinophagia bacterium]|nr:gliding motility-associated C-terminal domain-containing protein [Chitinophagia bacterium]